MGGGFKLSSKPQHVFKIGATVQRVAKMQFVFSNLSTDNTQEHPLCGFIAIMGNQEEKSCLCCQWYQPDTPGL